MAASPQKLHSRISAARRENRGLSHAGRRHRAFSPRAAARGGGGGEGGM